SALAPDDAIRFSISTNLDGFVGVIGIDSAQIVTPYVPQGGHLVRISKAKDVLLEGSTVLDATLGPEKIIAVRCSASSSVAAIVRAGERALAAAGGDPAAVTTLGLDCAEPAFLIRKVAR